ncbi:hypothetical protein CSUB01_04215 [Colletotrichum sublineola]|uniref:Uncharacterized protein n=1 Tax=Colletotrichum sublineola TaxID=1173701 RepID=A0A066XVV6_COLSU|nr:hypothetical protein CSUB01_04215 [Colletotrichum sublineola]
MRVLVLLSAALVSLAGTSLAKPELIRSVSSPIYHLYLQSYPMDTSIPVLGPEASAEYFNIAGTIQSANSSLYLGIKSDMTSYKSLLFGKDSIDAWGLEGDTIMTKQGSSWGRQLNFLASESLAVRKNTQPDIGLLAVVDDVASVYVVTRSVIH